MPKHEPVQYQPPEAYVKALGAFHGILGGLLFEFARQDLDMRCIIIRNFFARTDMTIRAIFRLWELQDYQNCWILHRCLLDRFFHLACLNERDEFVTFEAWSFLERYKALNCLKSDPEFRDKLGREAYELTSDEKQRAKRLSTNPPVWQRPKAEEVAKHMGMRFLYSYGYDYASTHIHPMADDGLQDFFTITHLEPSPDFPDQRVILSNTLLVGSMIVQEGLNASTLKWRAIVYDFFEDIRRFVGTGSTAYGLSFVKLGRLLEQRVRLCEATDGSSPPSKPV